MAGGGGGKAGQEEDCVRRCKKKTLNDARKASNAETAKTAEQTSNKKETLQPDEGAAPATLRAASRHEKKSQAPVSSPVSAIQSLDLAGAIKRPMPTIIHPMLATPVNEAFDGPEWLFEIKWDGYRAVAFVDDGKARLVSRNQNDLTPRYPELKDLAKSVKAKTAILDGEVVALDEEGRASFSLMQQRTGFRPGGRRMAANADVPVLYYVFDLLYLDGYDLRRVTLEERKNKLALLLTTGDSVRFSDHYAEHGKALFEIARQKGLEGILAKKRDSTYHEQRSSEWLKIKIRHNVDCVIGGYTEPEGSRAHFGSIVLGLYDANKNLIHVGQAGSGFDQKSLEDVWKRLQKLETKKNPFHGEVEALRKTCWVRPELVAEIEYAEWTGGQESGKLAGTGPKLRAPVFLGLRDDKDPKECTFEEAKTAEG